MADFASLIWHRCDLSDSNWDDVRSFVDQMRMTSSIVFAELDALVRTGHTHISNAPQPTRGTPWLFNGTKWLKNGAPRKALAVRGTPWLFNGTKWLKNGAPREALAVRGTPWLFNGTKWLKNGAQNKLLKRVKSKRLKTMA